MKNDIYAGRNYSEDWIPIKQIANGMIELDTNEFVCGVKVQPRNIFIVPQQERTNVIKRTDRKMFRYFYRKRNK